MSRRDELVAATRSGMAASVGDQNPYVGQGLLADLWMGGYRLMLFGLIENSQARQLELHGE